MLEIGDDEIQVMNRLIHAEKVQHLVEEISFPQPVVIDIVRQLFHHRYIKAVDARNTQRLTINLDQHLLDFLIQFERGQLQQPDRLLQLGRERQVL